MADVATVTTEQRGNGSVASSPAYSFRGTPVREVAKSDMTSRLDSDGGGVNIMLDVGVFCPCCAKTAENITVGGRVVSCNHAEITHDDDPFASGENKATFARRLKHFKALDSGVLSVDVHEPRSPRDEFLGNISELNDVFRPVTTTEMTSPVSNTKSSLSSPRTPDSVDERSSATYASSICESLETSLRSINELADEWGCRGEEPLRPGLPAPSRRRFPSQEVTTGNRPSNGRVRFSDDVVLRNRPRLNTASAADGVEIRRTGGAAYTANHRKRFSDDVTMFCYHKEPVVERPSRNAMSVSPVEMLNRDDDSDAGSMSDESRALEELLADLTGTSSRKQRRTKCDGDRNSNVPVLVPGARFNGNASTPGVCQANLKRDSRGQITPSSNGGLLSHPVQRHVSYPAASNGVVAKRPVTSSRVGEPDLGMVPIGDDMNDELQEILSLSRTISSGCSNDILVEVIANALKRSVTREYSVTRSDSPEADIDTVLERADTEVFTGDVTLRRVFSVHRDHSGSCAASRARQSSLSRLSAPHEDATDGSTICGHCGFTVGCKRTCQNEAEHTSDVVVQQKWAIKNNSIAARTDALTTSPVAVVNRDDVTLQDEAPHPVQDCKLETVRVEPANAQKINNPDSTHLRPAQTKVVESTIESEFEEALENVTDADSSFHADPSTDSPPAKPGTSATVEHWNNDFMKPSRPQPTSSCECIADDRSTRSGNDVDTDASGVQWSCDDTTDESDPEWAGYKGEKRGSFGQLIGDTLRMTEEILATFDHISCDDVEVVDGAETIPGEDKKSDMALPRNDTPDLLRSKPDDQRESVDVSSSNEAVTSDADTVVAKSIVSADRPTGVHQQQRREMFVANTEAESGECFFPYLEVIPPGPPMIQKAPYTIEPAPPIDEPTKREAIFNDFVKTGAATVETRERSRTPESDAPFVQATREVVPNSGSAEVLNELCVVTTDEEPDLDVLVENNTTSVITPNKQERSAITTDVASESNSATGGNDAATCTPKVKQKRKYVGARERVEVAQFTQFRQADNEDNGAANKSVHFETHYVGIGNVDNEYRRNASTAINARVQQETVVDKACIVVEDGRTRNDEVVPPVVVELGEMREVKRRDLEADIPAPRIADKTEHHAIVQQSDDSTATRDGEWRTVLCEESSDLADAGCDLQQATSQHGARYVYRASSTRGNTERFDEMKRRAGLDATSALTAAGKMDSEEQVVSEELDIKKVTLLFTLPKEIRPIIPTRPPGQARGKKIIHIRRVTRIKADGTTEVIQAPTARTVIYASKAAVTAATVASSGDDKRATTSEKPLASATEASSKALAHNPMKPPDTIPVEINMKYRHTKLRKYCKVAPLQRCSIEPCTDSRVQETTQERCAAEQRLVDKEVSKLANGRVVGLWGTRVNGGEHSSDIASGRGLGNTHANVVGKDTKVINSNTSSTTPQNGGVVKTKPLPVVKPKPKIPSWLLAELSARPIDCGNNQDARVSNDIAASTDGPAKQRQTTTPPPVMRRFKETTL